MRWSPDEPLVIPVGHLGGLFDQAEVRVGAGLERLSTGEFLLWAAAHGSPAMGRAIGTRPMVIHAADGLGVPDPAGTLAGLADRGLVAILPDVSAAMAFARMARVRPLMLGLGNQDRSPDRFGIGRPTYPVVEVDATTYRIWSTAAAFTSLWELCRSTDDDGSDQEATDLLVTVLDQLHTLLAVNVAYVDVALPEPAAR